MSLRAHCVAPCSQGGLHHPDNLQVIPATINCRKGAKENDQVMANFHAGEIDMTTMDADVAEVVLVHSAFRVR